MSFWMAIWGRFLVCGNGAMLEFVKNDMSDVYDEVGKKFDSDGGKSRPQDHGANEIPSFAIVDKCRLTSSLVELEARTGALSARSQVECGISACQFS